MSFLPPYRPGNKLSIVGTQWSNGTQVGLLCLTNYSSWETVTLPPGSFDLSGLNYAAVAAWGFNCIRLPVNEAAWMQRTCVDANHTRIAPYPNYRALFQATVAAAHAAGLYVIIDLHWTLAGNGLPRSQDMMTNSDNSIDFWTDMAAAFANDPAVAFELFNEPFLPGAAGVVTMLDGTVATTPAQYAKVIAQGGWQSQIAYQSTVGPNYFTTCHVLEVSSIIGIFAPGDMITQGAVTATVYDYHVGKDGIARIMYPSSITGFTAGAITNSTGATATVANAAGRVGIAGYQQSANAVRSVAPTTPILVGMNGYSNDIQDWLPNVITDPAKQLSCANHPYPSCEGTQSATVVNPGSGYFGMQGTCTGTSGNPGTLTDPAQNWAVNAHVGRFVYSANSPYKVLSNTAKVLTLGDANGNQTWAAPSGAYILGDRIVLPQGPGCYFPPWLLVSGVDANGGVTGAYAQMPTEAASGWGQGRGGLQLAWNAAGSLIPPNPVGGASSRGSGATFNLAWGWASGTPASNPVTAWPVQDAILAAGYPITITETGDYSAVGMTAAQALWILTIIARCKAAGISFGCWVFNPWRWQNEFYTLIQNTTGTPTPGYGQAVLSFTQSLLGKIMHATLTLTLPTARKDGTAATAAMCASINIYKDGVKYANIPASTLTWSDPVTAVNGDVYTVSVVDTQTPAVEGTPSSPVTVGGITTVLAPLGAPMVVLAVA